MLYFIIRMYCWICNIIDVICITTIQLKGRKGNSCIRVNFYILLELSWYKFEAASDKIYIVSPGITTKK